MKPSALIHVSAATRLFVWFVLVAALGFFGSFQPGVASQAATKLIVIANTAVPERRLDADALRAVFLRKRLAWSDGQTAIPINQPSGNPARVLFDQTVMGFSADQAARFWIDARIRSGMQPPRTIAGDAMIVRVVAMLAGTISYVSADQASTGMHVVARIESGRVLPP